MSRGRQDPGTGSPVPAASGRAALFAGGLGDAGDRAERARALSPRHLEAIAVSDRRLRGSLGGPDRAGPDHAAIAGVLRAVHRADRYELPGNLYLPIGRHDSVGLEDVPAAFWGRLRPRRLGSAGVARQR